MFSESLYSFHTVSADKNQSNNQKGLLEDEPCQYSNGNNEPGSKAKGNRDHELVGRWGSPRHGGGVGVRISTSVSGKFDKRCPKPSEGYVPPHYVGLPKYWLPNETFHPEINPRSQRITKWENYVGNSERYHAICELVKELWLANAPVNGNEMGIDGVNGALRQLGIEVWSPLAENFFSELSLNETNGQRLVGYSAFKRVFVRELQALLTPSSGTNRLDGEGVPRGDTCGVRLCDPNTICSSIQTLRRHQSTQGASSKNTVSSAATSSSFRRTAAGEPSVGWPGISDICSALSGHDLLGVTAADVYLSPDSRRRSSILGSSSTGTDALQRVMGRGNQGLYPLPIGANGKTLDGVSVVSRMSIANSCEGDSCTPVARSRRSSSHRSALAVVTSPNKCEGRKLRRADEGSPEAAGAQRRGRSTTKTKGGKQKTRQKSRGSSATPRRPSRKSSSKRRNRSGSKRRNRSGSKRRNRSSSSRGRLPQECEGRDDSSTSLSSVRIVKNPTGTQRDGSVVEDESHYGPCDAAGRGSYRSRVMTLHRWRRTSPPVLCVDVRMPDDKRGTFDVYRGDTVEGLVGDFASAYNLSDRLSKRLERLLARKLEYYKWKL
ncbi:uncharacterized protein TEOVI_000437900 [Trypanosoma equiperdum]|uniref:Uncharacterized protein n=1 Tax=Trypanosoma equiperdum TaxID=5694 RepID=A0A1G4IKD5_TRYEQ|nr:hypothetical protein, conserved [Trypanosoma equiperdum]